MTSFNLNDIIFDLNDALFLNFPDTDLMPVPGNFYFIKNKTIKKSLTFDYNYFTEIEAWEYLKMDKRKSTFFWDTLRLSCYPGHNYISYQKNLFYLEFISIYGWSEFVIKYITLK